MYNNPASTRHGTDVVFMIVGPVEIMWSNMLKCVVFHMFSTFMCNTVQIRSYSGYLEIHRRSF